MKRRKFLAIVDDWERLERYEDHLHGLFEFHSSPFGGHGVELAIQEQPEIILIDLEFEDMNEEEALSLIRAQDSFQNTLVILVSNTTLENNSVATENTLVFQRPIKMESILAFLKSSMDLND